MPAGIIFETLFLLAVTTGFGTAIVGLAVYMVAGLRRP
jgi:hypothetical protein